jgi:integrase
MRSAPSWRDLLGGSSRRSVLRDTRRLRRPPIPTTSATRPRVISAGTVIRDLGLLRAIFEVARLEWDIPLVENPVAKVRKPKAPDARERRLMPGELDHLLMACEANRNNWLRCGILLAIETGMRRGELLSIRWGDAKFECYFADAGDDERPRAAQSADGGRGQAAPGRHEPGSQASGSGIAGNGERIPAVLGTLQTAGRPTSARPARFSFPWSSARGGKPVFRAGPERPGSRLDKRALYRPRILRHRFASMRPGGACPSGRAGTGLASGGRVARSASARCRPA